MAIRGEFWHAVNSQLANELRTISIYDLEDLVHGFVGLFPYIGDWKTMGPAFLDCATLLQGCPPTAARRALPSVWSDVFVHFVYCLLFTKLTCLFERARVARAIYQ